MEKIRLGIIGLGGRGKVLLPSIQAISAFHVEAVCDLYPERVEEYVRVCEEEYGLHPFATKDYRELLERPLDAVIVSTTWNTHVPIALEAMQAGLHVGMEVGGAYCEKDCWDLVNTSQSTGKICMLLENCCYGDNELTVFHMARLGLFGEIVHAQGGYEHDLREQIALGRELKHGRMPNFLHRNGDLYPTHQLGPIAKLLDINRGNRILSLVSMASKARGLGAWVKNNRPDNPELAMAEWKEGDVVTSILKCANGETIVLNHGCTLPRPYSRDGRIQGTKGIWLEERDGIYLESEKEAGMSNLEGEHEWTPMQEYKDKYRHPLWKEYESLQIKKVGHNDMDYLVLCAFADSVLNGEDSPIDVYDTALWMSITYLSEQSVAMGGMPVPVPDFTKGAWINRKPERRSKYALSQVCWEKFARG